MRIEYTLDAKDYLEHQLFIASNSPVIKKQRMRSKFIFPILYMFIGIISSTGEKSFVPFVIFSVIAVLWYFIYPLRVRKLYVNAYLKQVNETFKNSIGKKKTLTFEDGFIVITAEESGSKIQMSEKEIVRIDELNRILLVGSKTGIDLLIARSESANFESLRKYVKEIASKHKIPFERHENWKWK